MSEERISTKAEMMAHIERDLAALQSLLDRLTPEQFTQIKDTNGWSVKDHLAHITAWERSVITFLTGQPRHIGLGVSEEVYLSSDDDVVNEAIFRQAQKKSLRQVRSDFKAVHADLMKLITSMDEYALHQPYVYYLPDEPGEGDGPPAINVIYGNTAHHFREHRAWIEQLVKDS